MEEDLRKELADATASALNWRQQWKDAFDISMRLGMRVDELTDALAAARQQLVTLGGDVVEVDGKIVSDAIQAAVLSVVDAALRRAKGEA